MAGDPRYAYVPAAAVADGMTAPPACRRRACASAARSGALAACAALALLGAAAWLRSGPLGRAAAATAREGAADGQITFLQQSGGQGGCSFSENCEHTGCCTHAGFRCAKASKWWSKCEAHHARSRTLVPEAAGPAAGAPAAHPGDGGGAERACAGAGEDCTESRCCADNTFSCQARTDGMWWKSKCVKGPHGSPAAAPAAPPAAAAAPAAGGEGSAEVNHPERCGQSIQSLDVRGQWLVAERCAKQLVQKLSKADKLQLLHGSPGGMGYAGYIEVHGVTAPWGVVRLTMNDGPQGYNGYTPPTIGKGTQFPDLISVAASFDREAAAAYGAAMAEEFRAKGCNVLLGPDVEIVRSPFSGRTFESLSGEDPYLGGRMAAAYIGEVHKRGVIATAKHWLDNEQEAHRQELDVAVGDRAQHEIYMAPFKAAIDAGAGAVMCSYNKVYGEYACENSKLLTKLLREDLGFKGFVVSDWGAVHSGAKSAQSGLNVEMPAAKYFKDLGALSDETIEERASQVLASIYAAGHFHGSGPAIAWSWPPPFYTDATSDAHRLVAKRVIIESSVLLKNADGALPIADKSLKIALVGKACHDVKDPSYGQGDMYAAGGSGFVGTHNTVTPLDGLKAHLGPAGSVVWSPDESAARDADVAVLCAAGHEEEGTDRKDLRLPGARELVDAVRALPGKRRVILVAIVPGAVETEWIGDVDAALVMFMPGEQIGPAFADLLTGDATPGGRLPVTFPAADEQRFSKVQFPGVDLRSEFSEGVLVGYRWNDARGKPAAFPFGFGLSYTTFRFSDFKVQCGRAGANVTLTVENTGSRPGVAVPQVYVGFKSLLPMVRQLRGFEKVRVPAGGRAEVVFHLSDADWSFYNEDEQRWRSARQVGDVVTVSVGSSSAKFDWTGTLDGLMKTEEADIHFQQ